MTGAPGSKGVPHRSCAGDAQYDPRRVHGERVDARPAVGAVRSAGGPDGGEPHAVESGGSIATDTAK
jgi:hypothetical protein